MKTTFDHLSRNSAMKDLFRTLFELQMRLTQMKALDDSIEAEVEELIDSIDRIFEMILEIE